MEYISIIASIIIICAIIFLIWQYLYPNDREGFQGDMVGGKVVMSKEYCNSLQKHLDSYIALKKGNEGQYIQNLDKTIEDFRGYLKDYGC